VLPTKLIRRRSYHSSGHTHVVSGKSLNSFRKTMSFQGHCHRIQFLPCRSRNSTRLKDELGPGRVLSCDAVLTIAEWLRFLTVVRCLVGGTSSRFPMSSLMELLQLGESALHRKLHKSLDMWSSFLPNFKLHHEVIKYPRLDLVPIRLNISMFPPWIVDGETPIFSLHSRPRHFFKKSVVLLGWVILDQPSVRALPNWERGVELRLGRSSAFRC